MKSRTPYRSNGTHSCICQEFKITRLNLLNGIAEADKERLKKELFDYGATFSRNCTLPRGVQRNAENASQKFRQPLSRNFRQISSS